MKYNGTQTEEALRTLVSGECQTFARFLLFARQARREGFEKLAEVFEKTAYNELAHAEIFLGELDCLGTVRQALDEAIKTERYEWSTAYPAHAQTARAEGYAELAQRLDRIAGIEKWHEDVFQNWQDRIASASVFSGGSVWVCRNCGHHVEGENAPLTCPVCGRPTGTFEKATS